MKAVRPHPVLTRRRWLQSIASTAAVSSVAHWPALGLDCPTFGNLSTIYAAEQPRREQGEANPNTLRVMIDAYHSHTWIDTKPTPDLFDYHKLHGLGLAVSHLEQMQWDTFLRLSGPWTASTFEGSDTILLNLVSVDQPPFYVDEIAAIKSYLHRGGGMVVITDHTNCYYHAHVLAPLMRELGVELPTVTACDDPEHSMTEGMAWIAIRDFADHAITRGLHTVGYQCGGCVDPRYAIAWTGPRGWSDQGANPAYGEGVSIGLFGDLHSSPIEPPGKQPVLLAKAVGKGRLAIIADQNAVGNLFVGYADNLAMFLRAIHWTAGEKGNPPSLLPAPLPGKKRVWCFEPLQKYRYLFGDCFPGGFYHWFAWMSRYFDVRATDREFSQADLLVLHEESLIRSEHAFPFLQRFLDNRKNAILLSHPDHSQKEEWLSKLQISDAGMESSNPLPFLRWKSPAGGSLIWIKQPSLVSNEGFGKPEREPKQSQKRFETELAEWMLNLG